MNAQSDIALKRGNPASAGQASEVPMAASSLSLLAPLAARMAMPASALVALPTAIEVFASKAGMSVDLMVSECLQNAELRAYLAEICINAEAAL